MGDILSTLKTLQNTPVPNLLVVLGFILLLLGFVGKFGAIIELPSNRQKWAGIIGTLLLIAGISLFLVPNIESTAKDVPDPAEPITEPTEIKHTNPNMNNSSTPDSPNLTPREALVATGLLKTEQELSSGNKLFSFKFQLDGNLIVYDNTARKALWASNTNGSQADHLVMQDDGNLVLYTKDSTPVWQTKTNSNQDDYFLIMQNDGNLVLYRGKLHSENAVPIWATNTNQ